MSDRVRRRRVRLRRVLALALAVALPTAGRAETLEQAIIGAYTRNPQLLAQREALRATDEQVPQAVAAWRPTVQFTGTGGEALQSQRSTFAANGPQPLTLSSNTTATTNSQSLSVVQPVYVGGRIGAQIRSADEQVETARAQLTSTEQQILLQAVTAYLDVLRDLELVRLNRNNERVLSEQLDTARNRFGAGDALQSDVAQSEAALQGARADRASAEGALVSSRAAYLRAVGTPAENLVQPTALPPLPQTEEAAISLAMRDNPDLLGAIHSERSSRHDVDAASALLGPTVSLQLDLTRSENQASQGSVTRAAQLLARLNWPLYLSGSEYSQVRQRKDTASQHRFQVEQARMQVRQQVAQAWQALQTARAQVAYRLDQVRAAELALDAIARQAALGGATTLEVLTAQQVRLQAQVAVTVARHDEQLAAYGLRAALGQLRVEALGLKVRVYDPTAHYRRVRHQFFGTTPRGED